LFYIKIIARKKPRFIYAKTVSDVVFALALILMLRVNAALLLSFPLRDAHLPKFQLNNSKSAQKSQIFIENKAFTFTVPFPRIFLN